MIFRPALHGVKIIYDLLDFMTLPEVLNVFGYPFCSTLYVILVICPYKLVSFLDRGYRFYLKYLIQNTFLIVFIVLC